MGMPTTAADIVALLLLHLVCSSAVATPGEAASATLDLTKGAQLVEASSLAPVSNFPVLGRSVAAAPLDASNRRVFIGVTSSCCSLEEHARRQAIRETWARDIHAPPWDEQVQLRFFVAARADNKKPQFEELLQREADTYHDLVRLDQFIDSYGHLPNKTAWMIHWAITHTSTFMQLNQHNITSYPSKSAEHLEPPEDIISPWRYFLKIDSDCYLKLANLSKEYESGNLINFVKGLELTGVYTGAIEARSGFYPVRTRGSKWYVSYEDYPKGSPHTKYIAGWGYLLSYDLAFEVARHLTFQETEEEIAKDSQDKALPTAVPNDSQVDDSRVRPGWWSRLKWEDAMVGMIISQVYNGKILPQASPLFRSAWQRCAQDFLVKHLDAAQHPASSKLLRWIHNQVCCGLASNVYVELGGASLGAWNEPGRRLNFVRGNSAQRDIHAKHKSSNPHLSCLSLGFRGGAWDSWRKYRDTIDDKPTKIRAARSKVHTRQTIEGASSASGARL